MIGFVLEDACGPAVQRLAVVFAVFIIPFGGDVEPTLAHGLVSVEAQAALVERGGFVAGGFVARVDDHVEGEFRDFARIILVVAHVVFDHGEREPQADLGGGEPHAGCLQHGGVHRIDEFGERTLGKLAIIGHCPLAQHRFAGLHDGQELLLAAGFDELFDITVEFEVDFGVLSKHCFFP